MKPDPRLDLLGRSLRRDPRREVDGGARARPLGGRRAASPSSSTRARDQPADAFRAPARARDRGDPRPPQLRGVAAARRVRADREGRGACCRSSRRCGASVIRGSSRTSRRRSRAEPGRGRARGETSIPRGRYSASRRSFGEWMLLSGSAKPLRIVGMPLSASAGTIGSVPPERTSSGRVPITCSKTSRPSCTAGASEGTRPAGAAERRDTSSSAPSGDASRSSRSTAAAIVSTLLAGREPDREVGLREDRQHRLLEERRAAARSRSRRARARRSCAGRTPRPRVGSTGRAPASASISAPWTSSAQAARSSSVGGAIPARSGSGRRPSRGCTAARICSQRVHRVQRGAAEDPRVQVALAGADGRRGSR